MLERRKRQIPVGWLLPQNLIAVQRRPTQEGKRTVIARVK
jgi:hypothetical protein